MFAKDEVDIAKKKSEGQTFEMLKTTTRSTPRHEKPCVGVDSKQKYEDPKPHIVSSVSQRPTSCEKVSALDMRRLFRWARGTARSIRRH